MSSRHADLSNARRLAVARPTLRGCRSSSTVLNQVLCTIKLKFDHVTPLLQELHWLRVPERITFKLASLVFRCFNGTAPVYLADSITRAADVDTRRSLRLHSSSSTAVVDPVTRCSTIGDRAFTVAAARAWNSLPSCHISDVTVDFQATLKDVFVCDVVLMALTFTPLPVLPSTEHVAVFFFVCLSRVLEVFGQNATLIFSLIIIIIIINNNNNHVVTAWI